MISYQDILHLYDVITNLNNIGQLTKSQSKQLASYDNKIRESYVQAAKTANRRLARLEEKEFTSSPAYGRATWFTAEERSSLRFSESKRMNWNDMMRAYEEVNAFLYDETSTVRGERRREAGLDKIMPDADAKEKDAMIRFLESTAFAEMKKTIGTDIVKKAADAIEAGANVGDLKKLFKDFKAREASNELTVDQDIYTEVWSKWFIEPTDEE